jgi:hypothetical protein
MSNKDDGTLKKSANEKNKSKDIYHSGRFWILIGIAILLSSELFVYRENYLLIISNILLQFGVALIVMGIVAIILQFDDIKKYFQERLKEIVIQRSYLDSLSIEELTSIQIDTLKARYKGTDMDKEGSFLYHFQNKIQDYICHPYRENVTVSMLIEEDENNPEYFKVHDTVTYLCRENGGQIQDSVKWMYEDGEFEEIYDLNITIRCPNSPNDCNITCNIEGGCGDGIININKKLLDDKYKCDNKSIKGYLIPLKDMNIMLDKLKIEFSSIYAIKRNNMFIWSMTNPSKGVTMTISHPKGYKLTSFVGGSEPREYTSTSNGDMYTFIHEGWFLPRTGISWNLTKL